jgi:GT2 family glycosyltransferase
MQIDLSIIIVNWNTKDLLEDCLKSLIEIDWQSLHINSEIVVVDNASSDKSAEMVKKNFINVKLIENNFNTGFGKGANKAAKQATGTYYLISNADVVYSSSAIKCMISCLDSDSKITAVAPKLIGKDGKKQTSAFKFPTLKRLAFEQLLSLGNYGEISLKDEDSSKSDGLMNTFIEVDWVLGATFMIRAKDFLDMGEFKEKYFMYSEETDLFFRLKNRGGKIFYLPDVSVLHIGKGSSSQVSEKMLLQQTRSLIIYFEENHGKFSGLAAKIFIIIGQTTRFCLIKILSILFTRNQNYKTRAKIYLSLLKGLISSTSKLDKSKKP